ncbi:MAG: glycosyltransferase family 4 protein [Pirellulales bacterium]
MHITTVPVSLNFFRGQIGYLKEHGFTVSAISSPGEELDAAAVREEIDLYGVRMSRGIDPLRDIVSLFRLWRLLRRLRPRIVHSHTPKAALLGTIAARLTGTPAVMVSIFGLAQMTRTGLKRKLIDFMTRTSCRLAHRVWCDGDSMRNYLIEQNLCPAEKVVVLGAGSSNGVDAAGAFNPARYSRQDRDALRASYGIPIDVPVVCFVGRIVADKGMRELAAAWRRLRVEFPDLRLLIVGPFESQDPLEPADEHLLRNDDRIHLAGMRNDVPLHLASVDVLVNPSYREGFNVALLEASAMGLPVVASRIPGCVDPVVEEVTGLLVPKRDSTALADAIAKYLRDPELRAAHGSAGRSRTLKSFQPASIWTALEKEYRALVETNAPIPQVIPTRA